MLERGRNIEHIKDYTTAMKKPWEFEHRGKITEAQKATHPVQKRDYPYKEFNESFWVNDLDCPYTEVKRFDWYRGYHVGGRSLLWGRQSYRWNKWDFEANGKEGVAIDWPIRYEDVAPWYSYAEKFAGVQGSKEGWDVLPDGDFMPAMELNCAEKEVKKRLEAYYKNQRHITIGRSANITEPLQARTNCQYRNRCWRGCPFGGYFSTQSSTLPAAMKTGN